MICDQSLSASSFQRIPTPQPDDPKVSATPKHTQPLYAEEKVEEDVFAMLDPYLPGTETVRPFRKGSGVRIPSSF